MENDEENQISDRPNDPSKLASQNISDDDKEIETEREAIRPPNLIFIEDKIS